jgi:Holliday junction DNA helicase RuvA
MIGTLRGKLLIKTPAEVIVETSGVGYRVFVPVSTLAELPGEGSEVFLYTVTHVREDASRKRRRRSLCCFSAYPVSGRAWP